MTLGQKIAQARRGCRLTQDQLADLLGVTRQTVSKWEAGLACPETSRIAKLAQALKVTCDHLLGVQSTVTLQAIQDSAGNLSLDWSKLYPVLAEYPAEVDTRHYQRLFIQLHQQLMAAHGYSLQDAMLVLKDLLYQTYLHLQQP